MHFGQPAPMQNHSCSERFSFHIVGFSLIATCDHCHLPFCCTPPRKVYVISIIPPWVVHLNLQGDLTALPKEGLWR